MSDIRSPVRIGDDVAVLDLVPLASDMPTVEDLRMVLAAYRIRGMLGFRSRRAEVARIRREVTGAVHSVQPRTVVMVFEGTYRTEVVYTSLLAAVIIAMGLIAQKFNIGGPQAQHAPAHPSKGGLQPEANPT